MHSSRLFPTTSQLHEISEFEKFHFSWPNERLKNKLTTRNSQNIVRLYFENANEAKKIDRMLKTIVFTNIKDLHKDFN